MAVPRMDFRILETGVDMLDSVRCSRITLYAHPSEEPLGGWTKQMVALASFLPNYLDYYGGEIQVELTSSYEVNGEMRSSKFCAVIASECDALAVIHDKLLKPTVDAANVPNKPLDEELEDAS